jgi:hypothetical protein
MDIKKQAEIIHGRLAEQNLLEQLKQFAREEGYHWYLVEKVWYGVKHETEPDGWGDERHTLPCIEKILTAIQQNA